jgi:ribosome-binding protein aMBF1 (putative translation factor)
MASEGSPVGRSVEAAARRKRFQSPRYRDAHDRLAPFEQIARVVIMRRARLGLSKQEVAERMATTASVVSRIESGQHRTSTETIRRLAQALDGQAIFGFDFGTPSKPERELVAL